MNGTAILLLPNTVSQKDEKPHSAGLNNTATFQSLKYHMKKSPNVPLGMSRKFRPQTSQTPKAQTPRIFGV